MIRKFIIGVGALIGLVVVALISGLIYQQIATNSDLEKNPPPGNLYTVGELELHMYCIGEGKPTVILDPGAAAWSTHWLAVQNLVAKQVRVCSYDRAGLGWSTTLEEREIEPSSVSRQLHGLLQAAGEQPPFVLGVQSYGGYVAMLFHEEFGDEVCGIAFIESAHPKQWEEFPPSVTELLQEASGPIRTAKLMAQLGILRFIDIPLPPYSLQEQVDISLMFYKQPSFYNAVLSEYGSSIELPKAISEDFNFGDIPIRVVTGGRSAYLYCNDEAGGVPCVETQEVWDRLQADIASRSSNSVHITHPEATHDIITEYPEYVAEQILALIEQTRQSGDGGSCAAG